MKKPAWALVALGLSLGLGVLPSGVSGAQDIDVDALANEAVQRVREYVRINTINPPGNEIRAAEFFAAIFEAEGIDYEIAESAPGRGNIWARLEGGDEPALVLLHHSDVVPADERFWDTDPLSGELRDGYIYGRGAMDTKAGGILHLQTFLALHRAGVPLNRDVIFMATADEEAGGLYGAGWLVENRPEVFEDVGLLLNEGGFGWGADGQERFGVEVTQKVPLWLKLVAHGEPGHGAWPAAATSVTRLVAALERIRTHPFEPRIVPVVDANFKKMSPLEDEPWRSRFADMASTIRDPALLAEFRESYPSLHPLIRNTCSITMLEGSTKINVVPPEATAQLDCRLLPDQDPEAFTEELTALIDDPDIDIERTMGFSPAVSTTDTDLYRAIEAGVTHRFPDAVVLPLVQPGFTDSHFFRDLGIVSYGFFPMVISQEDFPRAHGNNERVTVENVKRGTRMMLEIVRAVVEEP
ncbi:MAG: M20/M25/M40 family metallo-hydrolase [Gemmatimonadota bacterium]|nr:MAG: M20/M25/M40 family metallo-hydrolase [Gemmatimonadota bacterium]